MLEVIPKIAKMQASYALGKPLALPLTLYDLLWPLTEKVRSEDANPFPNRVFVASAKP